MVGKLSGKRVMITGASSGIGEATARMLAAEGAAVALVSEQEAGLNAVMRSICETGGKAFAFVADFSRPEEVEGLVCRVEAQLGSLDALVNNAGIGMKSPILEMQDDHLRLLFEVNFFAMTSLCRQALRVMAPRRQGRILNISSAAGLFGCAGMSAYSATKGAMHAYTQALRVEAMEQGVHVYEVLPISVRTPFFDNAKTGTYRPTGIVLTAETVARSIVRCLASRRPGPEVLPYRGIRAIFVVTAIVPGLMARLAGRKYARRR